jgi:hypothetical protein
MEELKVHEKYYTILEDNSRYNFEDFSDTDIEIMLKYDLIKERNRKQFSTNFVGEFLTPDKNYISLPKNIEVSKDNVIFTKQLLKDYKNVKRDKKSIITSKTYSTKSNGEVKSEIYYYNILKECFIDYLTYEFIYPEERIITHRMEMDLDPADMDIFLTNYNKKLYGGGATYKSKNKSESEIGNIYYSTLLYLANKYANSEDKKIIQDMYEYTLEQGHKIKEKDEIVNGDPNIEEILKEIKNSNHEQIHNYIVNTLEDYYKSEKLSEKYEIYAFCAKNFEYVWEHICQIAFKHDFYFKRDTEFIKQKQISVQDEVQKETNSLSDIFSDYKDLKFVGDAKYYSSVDEIFRKELYDYNIGLDNKYPIVLFVSLDKTKLTKIQQQGNYKIYIFYIDLYETILDAKNKTYNTLENVQKILKDRGVL